MFKTMIQFDGETITTNYFKSFTQAQTDLFKTVNTYKLKGWNDIGGLFSPDSFQSKQLTKHDSDTKIQVQACRVSDKELEYIPHHSDSKQAQKFGHVLIDVLNEVCS